ncbi:unnamed protein product [Orchesella dallaii]|uniref:Uncharacterized protein n=1 Tax=Orchesella dallaii TaxID=48710 RepID=A0ABP1RJD4_9HEXA
MIFLILFYIAAVLTLQTFKILRKSILLKNRLPYQSTSRFYVTPPGSPQHTNLPPPLAPIAPVAETSHSFQLDWDNTHEEAARAARLETLRTLSLGPGRPDAPKPQHVKKPVDKNLGRYNNINVLTKSPTRYEKNCFR